MLPTYKYPSFVWLLEHGANFGQTWTFYTLYNAYTNTKKRIAELKLKRPLFEYPQVQPASLCRYCQVFTF